MFGFDGEYRRRPAQSLGGVSQTSDRETVIRKAKQERQKRSELRLQNQGAVVIQSYTRSFLIRQRCKNYERELFDEFFRMHRDKVLEDENLTFLLRRILFFYNRKNTQDTERLIEICQHLVRNPGRMLQNAATDFIWLHRLKKILDVCITQLFIPHVAQAIPLRMLEIFTSGSSVERYVENEKLVQSYLDRIFLYLIKREYFYRIRLLIDEKCPPLDGDTLHPPNKFTEALYELLLRPLLLSNKSEVFSQGTTICHSFIKHILAKPFTEPIRNFVLPSMAANKEFPFEYLIKSLEHSARKQQQEKMQVDENINIPTFTRVSAVVTYNEEKKEVRSDDIFTSFLLNAVLILDKHKLDMLHSKSLLPDYIKIIATVSPIILQLPKISSHIENINQRSDDSESSEEDDDEIYIKRSKDTEENNCKTLSSIERDALFESISILNESQHVNAIVGSVEAYLSDENVLYGLCEICHNLMIYNKAAILQYKLLYTLAFMPQVIRAIWFTLAAESSKLGFSAPLTLISKGVVPKQCGVMRTIPMLASFCLLFGRLLPTLHDVEFCEENLLDIDTPQPLTNHVRLMPFSIAEIKQLSKTLKEISMGLVELAFPETRTGLREHYRFVLGPANFDDDKIKQQKQIWANLLKVVVFVLNQIHTRDLRLRFCSESHWIVNQLDLPLDRPTDLPLTRGTRLRGLRPFQPIRDFTRKDCENGPPMSTKQIRSITILREIPFVVAFSKRVGILQGLIAADKLRVQGDLQAFLQGPSILITVRRAYLYEDAYDKLRLENEPDLRLKFRVQFVSSLGLDEAGIDGGGIFREFLSELIKTSFDPNRGFFMVTTDNKLYPNPNVSDLFPDFDKHYFFIGRILGKAIYENLLVELPLAEFFLTKLAGKYADVDIHQLASLDPELYKNLLYLKDYEGDVSELNLDFTVTTSSFGQTQLVELKPNGQSISVTDSNRIEYLQLMADFKLNKQIQRHCSSFRKGLSNVLPVEWLYMFSNKELQILISGAEIPIDLEDLKKHCKYGGEYSSEHPSIVVFWSVLEKFNDLQRRQLLKFVTSCSRPPLLGFRDLDPPFFIQNAGDMERLPTASTCTNLLKLPPFTTEEQMREKLLYAIQAGVGFELS
ncbi:ubiquitin-protein ligase E3C [Teleopsis dalmanni]|uniref:ubiquitin-protein ligase E3C n=1 Tax=Teleopsis dalmanni TaxID=139649 RepID=UPI0018CEF6C8|nr:ubiquitin-protein ligase E3C [Teleopsis dalmanni]